MKTYLALLFSMILISCSNNNSSNVIGIEYFPNGYETSLIGGDISNVQLLEDYMKYHNNKDVDLIKNLDHNDIKIYGSSGDSIVGSENHANFLEGWFKNNPPSWKANYLIANDYMNEEGKREHWVTSCYDVSFVVDSEKVNLSHIYDVQIDSGKVKTIYIYEKNK